MTEVERLQIGMATWLIVASMLVLPIYGFSLGFNMLAPSSGELVQLGAHVFPVSLEFDPKRLFTALFLHGSLAHFGTNALGILLFGGALESQTKSVLVPLVFVVTGVVGNLLTSLLYDPIAHGGLLGVSVGASGGVMGLLGYLTLLSRAPSYHASLNTKTLLWLAALTFVAGFVLPNIDNAAHLGGYVCGILLALPALVVRCATQQSHKAPHSDHEDAKAFAESSSAEDNS